MSELEVIEMNEGEEPTIIHSVALENRREFLKKLLVLLNENRGSEIPFSAIEDQYAIILTVLKDANYLLGKKGMLSPKLPLKYTNEAYESNHTVTKHIITNSQIYNQCFDFFVLF